MAKSAPKTPKPPKPPKVEKPPKEPKPPAELQVVTESKNVIEYPPSDSLGSKPDKRWWLVVEKSVKKYRTQAGPFATREEAEGASV